MDGLSLSLLMGAATVGLVHTLLGPDHYLPFVLLARAQGWGWTRTLGSAAACGVAHVLASALLGVLGLAGLAGGAAMGWIDGVESARGDWAAWTLVALGGAYALWGARTALRSSRQIEPHQHGGRVHIHSHGTEPHHHADPTSPASSQAVQTTSFWMLFLVFILGPCEPLIPLFILPASRGRLDLALATLAVYGLVTVLSIVLATALGLAGLRRVSFGPLERWAHTLSGVAVATSGGAVLAFGL